MLEKILKVYCKNVSNFQWTLMGIFTEFNKYFYDFITVTTEGHARADDPEIEIMRTQNLPKFYRFLIFKTI